MLLLHLQGCSAAATGKAGARRAAVLRAAAASLAEPPLSGRPPTRTPHGLPARGRHQWPGDREAPSHLHRRRPQRPRTTTTMTLSHSAPCPSPFARPRPGRRPGASGTRPRCVHPQKAEGSGCCQKCQQPTGSVGHSQYKGQIYCPYIPGQIPRAGTSTCGGCREEGGPARMRHFGVCAHALPLCTHVCIYILL